MATSSARTGAANKTAANTAAAVLRTPDNRISDIFSTSV
jgi:hypothetical protein